MARQGQGIAVGPTIVSQPRTSKPAVWLTLVLAASRLASKSGYSGRRMDKLGLPKHSGIELQILQIRRYEPVNSAG